MHIDGRLVAKQIKQALPKHPAKLAFILIGDNPASQTYVRMKGKACLEVGITSVNIHLPAHVSKSELIDHIETLNHDTSVHAILVQIPLPSHISEDVLSTIDPKKDVDGFHPLNVGRLSLNDPRAIIPCTPFGILKLLEAYHVETAGKHVVILGRSNIVGRPLATLLSQKRAQGNATVTLLHSKSGHHDLCKEADILIAAMGQPQLIHSIKPGAVVIDVGINRVNGKLVGDVDYDKVSRHASLITPVPGGVGPMTIAMLLHNTYLLASNHHLC